MCLLELREENRTYSPVRQVRGFAAAAPYNERSSLARSPRKQPRITPRARGPLIQARQASAFSALVADVSCGSMLSKKSKIEQLPKSRKSWF
jgi:hypothetical protein